MEKLLFVSRIKVFPSFFFTFSKKFFHFFKKNLGGIFCGKMRQFFLHFYKNLYSRVTNYTVC